MLLLCSCYSPENTVKGTLIRFSAFGEIMRKSLIIMVPGEGVEPSLPNGKRILSPLRLPFRHPGNMLIYNRSNDFSSPSISEISTGLDIHNLKLRARFPMIFVYLRRCYHVKFGLRYRIYAPVERDKFHLRIFSVPEYAA